LLGYAGRIHLFVSVVTDATSCSKEVIHAVATASTCNPFTSLLLIAQVTDCHVIFIAIADSITRVSIASSMARAGDPFTDIAKFPIQTGQTLCIVTVVTFANSFVVFLYALAMTATVLVFANIGQNHGNRIGNTG